MKKTDKTMTKTTLTLEEQVKLMSKEDAIEHLYNLFSKEKDKTKRIEIFALYNQVARQ